MDAMLREWLKKRGTQFNPEVDTDPLAVFSTPEDGGAADVARKPLAIPVEAQATQSEPTPEDVSEASDPRASPETTDMRGSFDRMSNIFMAAGGLPQQPLRGNPYVTERDAMRDWVMKKDAAKRADANTQNQESRTAAYLAATQSQREQGLAAQALRAEQEGRKEEAEKFRRELETEKQRTAKEKEDFDQKLDTRKMDLEEKRFAKKSAKPTTPSIQERRQGMREDAIKPRAGWEKIVATDPAFRDATQAKSFDDSSAAFDALRNHRHHAAEALKKFKEASTLAEKDKWLQVVNQQMANIASKLRVAEGLNSSDASNHAVDTMLGLTNGSIASFKNFANEGRLDAILDSAIDSAGTNLDTLAKNNNLRRSKASPAEGGDEMIRVTDKATGKSGTMPRSKFNPDKYEMAK